LEKSKTTLRNDIILNSSIKKERNIASLREVTENALSDVL
jgi:hypothetical protein